MVVVREWPHVPRAPLALWMLGALVLALGGCERDPQSQSQSQLSPSSGERDFPETAARCDVELIVLGNAQDGGAPQMGNPDDPAWGDPSLRRLATSLGVVDRRSGRRFMFEATPDMREQLQRLDEFAPVDAARPGLDGIFLTHAHIGHYAGLMFLGHESLGARGVAVYAMPRMAQYLTGNGPWSQLVKYENIVLQPMVSGEPVSIGEDLAVTALLVPHRQEFSEVVGYRIAGPARSAFFLPDIDSWAEWDAQGVRIEDIIAGVDLAFIDATFYADGEVAGRDMSGFPHPRIVDTMQRLAVLPAAERAKVRFIHLNHTNPVRFPQSKERAAILAAGYFVADEGERHCLSGRD